MTRRPWCTAGAPRNAAALWLFGWTLGLQLGGSSGFSEVEEGKLFGRGVSSNQDLAKFWFCGAFGLLDAPVGIYVGMLIRFFRGLHPSQLEQDFVHSHPKQRVPGTWPGVLFVQGAVFVFFEPRETKAISRRFPGLPLVHVAFGAATALSPGTDTAPKWWGRVPSNQPLCGYPAKKDEPPVSDAVVGIIDPNRREPDLVRWMPSTM